MREDYIDKFYEQSLNQPIPYRKGKLWGYSNIWGDILIEPQYDQVDFFYQTDLLDLDSYRASVKKDNSFFIINNRNTKLSNNYKEIEVIDPYDIEFVIYEIKTNNNKVGVFFKDKIIAEPIYDEVDNDNKYIKVKRNNKYGVVDLEGTFIIPIKYDAIEAITDEDSGVISKWEATVNNVIDNYSTINNTGVSFTDDDIFNDDFFSNMVTSIVKERNILKRIHNGEKQGVIIIKSNKKIEPEYDSIEVAYKMKYEFPTEIKDYNAMGKNILFIVEKEGKFGIIDEDSNIILPIEMDAINNNGYDIFELKKNGLIGKYNLPKKALFFTDYENISFPESIDLNNSENYKIYKIKKKDGHQDYIGENGIKYYED